MQKHGRLTVTKSQRHDYHLLNLSDGRAHSPYEAEREIFRLIAEGDEKQAREQLGSFMNANTPDHDKGTFAKNPLKQHEYTAVIFGAMACRAIIEGGVDPMVAYDWSDLWSFRVSEASNSAEYLQIILDVLHDACELVRQSTQVGTQSLCVRKAKQYVYQHLDQRLTVSDVASALGLSAGYLSATFRKEEGMAFKEYLTNKKLEAAMHLLSTTDDAMAQIAERLCFSSASHFADVFRRHVGVTPTSWRKTHRPVDWRDGAG